MSLKEWEEQVLDRHGAAERVKEIEEELRLATRLATLRNDAGVTQRELATRMGVSQPRIAAIERSKNVTIAILDEYVTALGGRLDITAVVASGRVPLPTPAAKRQPRRRNPSTKSKATGRTVVKSKSSATTTVRNAKSGKFVGRTSTQSATAPRAR